MDKSKGGRPREGATIKDAPIAVRTSPELKARIQAIAQANGRSLVQEVERRLKRSFEVDDRTGEGPNAALLKPILAAIKDAEQMTGCPSWLHDARAMGFVAAATMNTIETLRAELLSDPAAREAHIIGFRAVQRKRPIVDLLNQVGIEAALEPERTWQSNDAPEWIANLLAKGTVSPRNRDSERAQVDADARLSTEVKGYLCSMIDELSALDELAFHANEKAAAALKPKTAAFIEGERLYLKRQGSDDGA